MDLEDLTHKPLFDMDTEQFLGYAIGAVVDPESRRLLGIVSRTRFGRPKMVAPAASIHLMHDDGVIIERAGFRWLPLHRDIWRAWRRQRRAGMLSAVHENETIGTVVDFAAADDGRITHLVIQRSFVGKLIRVRSDKITKIEDGVVYLSDDALAKPKPRPSEAPPEEGGFVEGAAALFGKTLAKASHTVKKGARSSLVGKPAPWTVRDDSGAVMVVEGSPLTKESLDVEAARGRMGELTGAVAGGTLGRSLAKRKKKKQG